jgi:L-ascorbate peroxidase
MFATSTTQTRSSSCSRSLNKLSNMKKFRSIAVVNKNATRHAFSTNNVLKIKCVRDDININTNSNNSNESEKEGRTTTSNNNSSSSRRNALFAIMTTATATTFTTKAASAAFDLQKIAETLLKEKDMSANEDMNAIKEKRKLNLPKLEVEPLDRLEGAARTSGANKSKAQIEYAQYIAPIIEANIDLDFGSYIRLALADAGTHSVVGKKYGLNGSIRFELDRPENKGLQKAMDSIEKIKKECDSRTTQPVSYADLIAIVPHFAARIQFRNDYVEEMGSDDNYEFLFIGTNPFLGAKVRVGRLDATEADPAGLVPNLETATGEELLTWFKRMGRGPNELAALAPYLYEDPKKGVEIVSQDGTCERLLGVFETQRILGKRAPGPAVTIIKNFKQITDNAIPGGAMEIAPAVFDPPYVDYAFIKGGGEIPRVGAYPARPNSAREGGSVFALRMRGEEGSVSSMNKGAKLD